MSQVGTKHPHPKPEEPEHISCDVCMTEIPPSVAETAEGDDYVMHFCGVECMEAWRKHQKDEEE